MNLLIPGLAAITVLVAVPTVIRATLSRIPDPVPGEEPHCYGLDGYSSEICCDDPGFAVGGYGCYCLCHHHEAPAVDSRDTHETVGSHTGHHHHLHWHQGSMDLHSTNLPGA